MTIQVTRVKYTRGFSSHLMLLQSAGACLQLAKQTKDEWFPHALASIALSAFGVEALCNTLGTHYVPDWPDFESARPMAKIRLLCSVTETPYEKTSEPWRSLDWLFGLRNKIAHGKPTQLSEIHLMPADKVMETRHVPASTLEKQITLGNAERAVQAANAAFRLLIANLPAVDQTNLVASFTYWTVLGPPEK
jgi:hypothetical protein